MAEIDNKMNDDNKSNDNDDNKSIEVPPKAKRGPYNNIPPDMKLAIARKAHEDGIDAAIGHFHRLKLKYSSVRDWKIKYESTKRQTGIYLFAIYDFCDRKTFLLESIVLCALQFCAH